jgi:lysophospholipase L1-like esterase
LLFLIGILIILSAIEITVRFYEYTFLECFFLNSDATKNIDYNLRGKICDQSKLLKIIEYPVFQYEPNQYLDTININSFGFRGDDFSKIKQSDTYRIFMVGGSTTFGSGSTSDHTTIPAYLEEKFLENNYDVEVINAGVGAASSIEESYKIRNIYKEYNPDLFIVYDGWNDSFTHLTNNELDPLISRGDVIKSQKSSFQLWVSKNLEVYRTLYVLYPFISHHSIALSLNNDIYEKKSEIWNKRWSEICQENNNESIKTIILLQPIAGTGNKILSNDEKIHADYIKSVKSREQLDFYSKVLPIALCYASFDLRNTFDNIEESVYYDDGHISDFGNNIMANKIFENILPIIKNDIKKSM